MVFFLHNFIQPREASGCSYCHVKLMNSLGCVQAQDWLQFSLIWLLRTLLAGNFH